MNGGYKRMNDDKRKLENLKARYKRQNEKAKENYDRSSVLFPKGTIERIKSHGETVNGFINRVVADELERLDAANTSGGKTDTDFSDVPF
jgi:hypothetical protein